MSGRPYGSEENDDLDQAGSSAMGRNDGNRKKDLLNPDPLNPAYLINQFKEICDVNDAIAEALLQESGWNLEAAIHQFFFSQNPEALENQDNELQELRHRPPQQSVQRQAARANANVVVPRRAAPTTWMQWLHSLVILPFQFFYYTFGDILRFFYNFLLGPPPPRRRIPPATQRNATADRQLMQEQESEYARALAVDRARRDEERQREKERLEQEKLRNEEARRVAERDNHLRIRRLSIQDEVAATVVPTGANTVRIRVNFPSGTAFEHRFRIEDSLEMLFNAVFAHEACPKNFSLLSSYPRRVLNCTPEWYREFGAVEDPSNIRTFAEEGLINSDAVLVRDNDA